MPFCFSLKSEERFEFALEVPYAVSMAKDVSIPHYHCMYSVCEDTEILEG